MAKAKSPQTSEPISRNASKKGRFNAFSLEFSANGKHALSDFTSHENAEGTEFGNKDPFTDRAGTGKKDVMVGDS